MVVMVLRQPVSISAASAKLGATGSGTRTCVGRKELLVPSVTQKTFCHWKRKEELLVPVYVWLDGAQRCAPALRDLDPQEIQ